MMYRLPEDEIAKAEEKVMKILDECIEGNIIDTFTLDEIEENDGFFFLDKQIALLFEKIKNDVSLQKIEIQRDLSATCMLLEAKLKKLDSDLDFARGQASLCEAVLGSTRR